MTHNFKVGDRVEIVKHTSAVDFKKGDVAFITKISVDGTAMLGKDKSYIRGSNWCLISSLTPYCAPIGYTGKLKDMDLQDGDVVENRGARYTATNGTIYGAPFDLWKLNFTLISRANKQTHSVEWSNWNLSKQDGSFHEITGREYQTEKLGKTKQVAYRSRKIPKVEPVVENKMVTVRVDHDANSFFDMDYIDGKPDWATLNYTPF